MWDKYLLIPATSDLVNLVNLEISQWKCSHYCISAVFVLYILCGGPNITNIFDSLVSVNVQFLWHSKKVRRMHTLNHILNQYKPVSVGALTINQVFSRKPQIQGKSTNIGQPTKNVSFVLGISWYNTKHRIQHVICIRNLFTMVV